MISPSLIPWRVDRCVTWDVTITNTVATSFLILSAVSAAEATVKQKEAKYIGISGSHHFFPIASEIIGSTNEVSSAFVPALSHHRLHGLVSPLLVERPRFSLTCYTTCMTPFLPYLLHHWYDPSKRI